MALHPELGALAAILEEAGFRVKQVAPEEVSRGSVKSVYVTVAQKVLTRSPSRRSWNGPNREPGSSSRRRRGRSGTITPISPPSRPTACRGGGGAAEVRGTANGSKPFAVKHTDSKAVLATLRQLIEGPLPDAPSERAAAGEAIGAGSALRGPALDEFLAGLLALNRKLGPIVPTQEAPVVRGADPLVDAVIDLETTLDQSLPAGKMYAIPAAADYPGAVPDKAPRINRNLTIDGDWRGWLSGRGAAGWTAKEMRPTGLYAAPGEIITVTAPEAIAGKGFEVVIGSYGGGLENREKWERYPRLQRSVEINGPVTTISSGLGGLVTIRVPKDAKAGPLAFSLSGGVAAPVYVAGKTDLKQWRSEIRSTPRALGRARQRPHHPRPAEPLPPRSRRSRPGHAGRGARSSTRRRNCAAGSTATATAPSASSSTGRPRPATCTAAIRVAAPQDRSVEQAVDARALREEGNWGFFHEYGHNHQHDLWALPGTGETTCNLWSVYLFEEWVGKPREEATTRSVPSTGNSG